MLKATALPLALYRCQTWCISSTKAQQLWVFCDNALGKYLDLKVRHRLKDGGKNTEEVLLFVVTLNQSVRQGRKTQRAWDR